MKHLVLRKVGALLLITGVAFALPAYAVEYGATNSTGIGEKDAQQISTFMNDMSDEMKDMSSIINSDDINPDTTKMISRQMKQMGGMMSDMSGMMNKNVAMDAGSQKQMDQMLKQMGQMRKDIPDSLEKE